MGHGGARGQRGWAPGAERVTVSLRPGQQLCKRSPRFSLLQGGCGAGAYRASFLVGPSHCHPNPAPSRALLSFGASGCRPGPQTPVCGKRGRGLGLGGAWPELGRGPDHRPLRLAQPAARPIPGALLPPGGEARPCSLGLTCGTAGAPSSWKAAAGRWAGEDVRL